ncbi:MAG: MotA/TolQ/ExbB proton channel family protein [Muribaculaceae bacterium]|nr:MotA/TolQ/ExbB proton channel family protein [Muribaculaceae bacterium]
MEATKPNNPQPQAPKPAVKPQPQAAKPAAAKPQPKKANDKTVKSNVGGVKNAFLIILLCFVIAECLYIFVLGHVSNFVVTPEEGDPGQFSLFSDDKYTWTPAPNNLLGTVYKGGFVVPILLTCLFTVIALSIERAIAIGKAKGKGNTTKFVENVKAALQNKDIAKAEDLCRKQKGTVGAVVFQTLQKYKEMDKDTMLQKEQKLISIQQTLEEATAVEMPSLQQNLPVIATLTTLGTLLGLFGTVLGMIKSFQALSASGAPDSTELSTGISEALVNTATGIATAALALISYNYFSNKIDKMTYAIDELGFSIVSTFAATH